METYMQQIKRSTIKKSLSELSSLNCDYEFNSINKDEQQLTLLEKASLALANKLFISGWYNQSVFDKILINSKSTYNSIDLSFKFHISLLKHNDEYVACGLIDSEEQCISIFVKDNFRGMNFGTKIIEKTLKEANMTKDDIYAQYGKPGSSVFYAKNNIVTFRNERDYSYFRKRKLLDIYNNPDKRKNFINNEIQVAKAKISQKHTLISKILDKIPSISNSLNYHNDNDLNISSNYTKTEFINDNNLNVQKKNKNKP